LGLIVLVACCRPEAAIALRMRLNESVDELDRIKKKFAEVDFKAEQLTRDLTIAKSDCESLNSNVFPVLPGPGRASG